MALRRASAALTGVAVLAAQVHSVEAADGDACANYGEPGSVGAEFCQWMGKQCGMTDLETVKLGNFYHYGKLLRGLEAARDIKTGEKFGCVPQKCWLREESVPESFRDATERCNDDARLALYLAEELRKGEASEMATYYKMFPSEEDLKQFHPAYLEDQHLSKLHKNATYWPSWMNPIQQCWRNYRNARDGNAPEAALVYYAYVLVVTRRFDEVGMTPLLDLVNTKPKENINVKPSFGDDDQKVFCLEATKNIPKNTEILVDYGAEEKSAMLTFTTYGFALGHRWHNESNHGKGPLAKEVDSCRDLYRANFTVPPKKEDGPVWFNYYKFAQVHCFRREEYEEGWRTFFGTEKGKRVAAANCLIGLGAGLVFWSILNIREHNKNDRLKAEEAAQAAKQEPEGEEKEGADASAGSSKDGAATDDKAKRAKRSASPANTSKENGEADGEPRRRPQAKAPQEGAQD